MSSKLAPDLECLPKHRQGFCLVLLWLSDIDEPLVACGSKNKQIWPIGYCGEVVIRLSQHVAKLLDLLLPKCYLLL